ncbi:MAG TPA: chorismate-binding protein [Mycobacteriales bacterium]|nr:chorismate-binding protein [Mycobacteriales bacterium]
MRLVERARWEWWRGDPVDPASGLMRFLTAHGLPTDLSARVPPVAGAAGMAAVLVGAAGAAALGGAAGGAPSPVPAVPDLAVVAYDLRPAPHGEGVPAGAGRNGGRVQDAGGPAVAAARVGRWSTSWTDAEHAAAVRAVRAAIAEGDVYQVTVVGHRSAPYSGDPAAALAAVAALPGARYGGGLAGPGWAVATASPECLLTVERGLARTSPVKGTRPATASGRAELLASGKERAEHVMIVDLVRNDLGRLAVAGTVRVEQLFGLREWCGLWQAESTVAARLRPATSVADLLAAVLPGGSVTGAPKLAATGLAAALEPVGRGPAMGALGVLSADRLDLGLTIRTVAADADRLHLWAGGGITWGSDPYAEVAEAHAKADPVLAAIGAASC